MSNGMAEQHIRLEGIVKIPNASIRRSRAPVHYVATYIVYGQRCLASHKYASALTHYQHTKAMACSCVRQ